MHGAYCFSLILCFSHHSSQNLHVRMGSIQNPSAGLGCTGEAQGTLPTFPAGGNVLLERLLDLGPAMV